VRRRVRPLLFSRESPMITNLLVMQMNRRLRRSSGRTKPAGLPGVMALSSPNSSGDAGSSAFPGGGVVIRLKLSAITPKPQCVVEHGLRKRVYATQSLFQGCRLG
jgi:hypothetical protein